MTVHYLPQKYYPGYNSPRMSQSGDPLPSARKISEKLYQRKPERKDPIHTLIHATFGQFLDHDMTLTPISKLLLEGEYPWVARLLNNGIKVGIIIGYSAEIRTAELLDRYMYWACVDSRHFARLSGMYWGTRNYIYCAQTVMPLQPNMSASYAVAPRSHKMVLRQRIE